MRLLEIGMGCSMHNGVEGMHSLSVSRCLTIAGARFMSISEKASDSFLGTCAAVEEILDQHKGFLRGE